MTLPVAAVAFSAASSIFKGEEQAQQYEAQSRADKYNAALASRERSETLQVYGEREAAVRRKSAFEIGESNAQAGQTGFTNSGSILDIERQNAVLAELDAQNVRFEGQQKGRSLAEQEKLLKYQSSVANKNARNARLGGLIGAVGSGIGAYGNAQYL